MASCNFDSAEESASGGGLFVNHKEIQNTFALIPPTPQTYIEGDNFDLTIQHSANIIVTGVPRLELTIGAATVYADYLTGSGTGNLTFRYTILAGENDSDDVDLNSTIDLNGGTLTFNDDTGAVNANLSLLILDFQNQNVDTTAPTLTLVTPPIPQTYYKDQQLNFIAVFDDHVVVTGSPRLQIDIGGVTKFANYDAGSGSIGIFFKYIVTGTDVDLNGITLSSSIQLNGGSIQDLNGNNGTLNFIPLPMPTTLVDGALPFVTALVPPANNVYLDTEILTLVVQFSDDVIITGAPRVEAAIGLNTRYFNYISGSGTDEITFRYIAQESDDDLDGIALASSIDLNAGTVQSLSLVNADLDLSPPILPNVRIDAGNALITNIVVPIDTTYVQTDELYFTATYDRVVSITGTPRLEIALASGTVYADYISGSDSDEIVFRYQVQSGELDLDGLTVQNTVDLNNGTIIANNGLNSNLDITTVVTGLTTTGLIINASGASVANVTPPADNNYLTGTNLDFVVTFTKNVDVIGTPRIQVDVGGSAKFANYISGTGSSVITFRYIAAAPDSDIDGIEFFSNNIELNGGTINDSGATPADLDMSLFVPNMAGVEVNKAIVSISSMIPPGNSTYTLTQDIDFLVNTSENVDVTGTPRISIDIGGTTKFATYQTGTGTSTLIFRYNVEAGLTDIDGITITSPLDLNGGTIKSVTLIDLDSTFTPPLMGSVFVDSIVPQITSVTPPADNSYLEAQDIDFIINTDESIYVIGVPRIQIDIGGITKYADYLSGTGSTALTFRYTVEAGLNDSDGIFITSPVDLNSGTMKNTGLEDLNISFSAPAMPAVLVDSVVPLITSVTPPADQIYLETETLTFIVNTNAVIDIALGTPRIAIDIGGTTKYATYQSGTGTTALTFEYIIEAGLNDLDGILITTPIDANSATLQDSALSNLDLNFTAPILLSVQVDSSVPTVAITNPADSSFINTLNDSAIFTVSGTCSEATKTVTIEVDAGAATGPVNFLCDGTNFTGTIDTTGLSEAAHTLVAKLTDDALNEGISTTINLTKDVTAPTITSVVAPVNNWYIDSNNLDFIVNLDEVTGSTGTNRIQIDIGGVTKYADILSGSGSTALTYRYTITTPDEDTNGIGFASTSIDLNAGTLLDIAGNSINLNLDATIALPNTSSIFVDGIIPLVTITSAAAINAANENTYTVSGTCSEDGRFINVDIDGIALAPICSGGAWITNTTNVSARPDNPVFPITADHDDAAGNDAIQASLTVDKNATTPTVSITLAESVTSANVTAYTVSGSCTESGIIVDVYVGALNFQPNCSGGTWTTGFIDVTLVPDNPSVLVTADHSSATQATTSIDKDSVSDTVIISSAPNISLANETSYIVSGTCSVNAVMVDVYIDTLNFQPNCSGGSWSTGTVDVSSIIDGAVTITADHNSATQATTTVNKNTATPTVAGLSAPVTLSTTIDLNWNLNDPGGFTIDDFDINYRVKGTPTWLAFADGVSLLTSATVTGLVASTTYEFRVRVQYDTTFFSDWTTTVEGETKPDDPLFDSPNAAMNVGGATSTSVVAYYDATAVTLNGTPIAGSPLSKGQTAIIATSQFDVIDADKPIFTAGILGSGTGGSGANMVWLPTSWAGKSFSFNATRSNPQNLFVFAIEATTIQVKQGATVLDSATIAAGTGTTLNWSVYGSYQVISTGTILALHMSGIGTTRHDPKPVLPGFTEVIGFPSNSMRLTADLDSTNYNLIHSNSITAAGSLNKTDSITVSPQGSPASLYQGDSLLISADRKISGASFADSNGLCAAPFLPTNLMKKRYVINATSNYIAFASKQAGAISVYSPAQTIGVDTPVATLNLSRTGANPNAPYKARFGTYTAGHRFVSTVPMAGWYHPSVEVGSAPFDETIMYGTNE